MNNDDRDVTLHVKKAKPVVFVGKPAVNDGEQRRQACCELKKHADNALLTRCCRQQ